MIKQLFKHLPTSVQQRFRRYYYYRKFVSATKSEEKDIQLIDGIVQRGDIVLDIGANFGLYTKFLAERVGSAGHVHSFEPVPITADVLSYNVRRAGLSHVSVHSCAVSHTTGTAVITIPIAADGGESLYEASLEHNGAESGLVVKTVALDDFFRDLQRLDFVKIDVEGHEPPALEGMKELVKRLHPMFLIEINGAFSEGTVAYAVQTMMHSWGYAMYYYDGHNIRRSSGDEQYVNYLFLREEHVTKVGLLRP